LPDLVRHIKDEDVLITRIKPEPLVGSGNDTTPQALHAANRRHMAARIAPLG
jgi:hypothetical protein